MTSQIKNYLQQLKRIQEEAEAKIKMAKFSKELEKLRVEYLSRKSKINKIIKDLKNLSDKERPKVGKLANQIKNNLVSKINFKLKQVQNLSTKEDYVDLTASPDFLPDYGHLHPITQVINEIIEIFSFLGFQVVEGPEIETDWYNFTALNIPPDHPARDMQDSFYINEKYLPRTQTSSVQVRFMEKNKPPFKIIVPGRTYRRESDVTHTIMFHQLEGLMVDKKVNFSDLKGVLTYFAHSFFGPQRKVRFRPSYFPFTEPSAEMDVSCGICQGKGCRSCKYSGWLEILGSGMVHPEVLKNGGVDNKKYQGFAFGMGIERLVMLKYNLDDIRLFFENDLRFLEQF